MFTRIKYGIEVYGTCSDTLVKKVQVMQNRLLKILFGYNYRHGTNEFHLDLGFLKVKDVYQLNVLNFVHDCLSGNIIDSFIQYFQTKSELQYPNTRNKDNITSSKVRTNHGKSTVKFTGAKLWNHFKLNLDIHSSKPILKRHLTAVFLSSYEC